MYRFLEKELQKWKISPARLPLLLRGPRQVGKTYLVEMFGRSSFESFVSVNFEAQPEAIACFETFHPDEILLRLQTILGQTITPGKTLLFLDEIQVCPQAIMALRYFKEKLPKLHVIGAGSLLEFALIQGKFSFPVGRVQFMYLKPLSFQEFVLARGKKHELKNLQTATLESAPALDLHQQMLQLVREYCLIGGMPSAVSNFCTTLDISQASLMQEVLLSTYRADFGKYATPTEQRYLKLLFAGVFSTVAQHFKYAKIDPHIRSRELKHALDHLEWAGLVKFVHSSTAEGIPLSATIKLNRFKLLFFDVGLVQHALQVDPKQLLSGDLIQVNKGAIAEQFVGQELLSYAPPAQAAQLFFWEREKRSSSAEVDYLYTHRQQIVPIEVKSGSSGHLRSLKQFMTEKNSSLGMRLSLNPLGYENGVLSVPFYMIAEIPRLLDRALVPR